MELGRASESACGASRGLVGLGGRNVRSRQSPVDCRRVSSVNRGPATHDFHQPTRDSRLATVFSTMRRPSVIAHRGASGYEYENSRAAFRRAIMLDADGVELDVHSTLDGGIVVHHDPEIPAAGPICRLSLAEARKLRIPNGEPLPQLAEILELEGSRDVWVEVKG